MIEQTITLLSKKGMKELSKKIADLGRRQNDIRVRLRELDKGVSHEERLRRIEALSELEAVEDDLVSHKEVMRTARLIPSKRARLKVALGSVVDLIDQQGRLFRYTIVDSIEVNPSDGRISAASPLGSTLLGKAVKETVNLTVGATTRSLQLVKIS
jgi:transcription elongation factor GreA